MRFNVYKPSVFKYSALAIVGVCTLMVASPISVQAQSGDSAAAAAAEIRFQQLERELRRLTGQLEEQSYEIRRLKEEVARLVGELEVRVKDLEGGSTAQFGSAGNRPGQGNVPLANNSETQPKDVLKPPSGNKPSASFQYQPPNSGEQSLGTLNNGAATSSGDPARAYDHAYSYIKARNFERAEAEFAQFIGGYPTSPLVSNAKYWYGETFYVRGNYEKAARIFAEGYQKFPKGPKAASNLLKLGMSLVGMGKNDDACVAFKQLKKEYSKSAVPVLKRADTEMKRINCR